MMSEQEIISPTSEHEFQLNLIGHYAGFVSRLIAFSIDTVFISLVAFIVTWFINSLVEILHIMPMLDFIEKQFPQVTPIIARFVGPVSAGFLIFLFTVLYHVLLWYFTGQTVGKALMGMRIVPLNGGRIPLWRAFLRYFSYYLSGLVLGLGFFWIIVDNRRMGWHDKLAQTCVLYTWEARPDEKFLRETTEILKARRKARKQIKEKENQK